MKLRQSEQEEDK